MLKKTCFLVLAAILVLLTMSSKAQAWGAYHTGYTHVGYGGVQHYGSTSIYGAGGGYRSYSGYHYGGYHYGGYHYGGYGGYTHTSYGYARRW